MSDPKDEREALARLMCAALGDDWDREGDEGLMQAYGPMADRILAAGFTRGDSAAMREALDTAARILKPIADDLAPLKNKPNYRYQTSSGGRACIDAYEVLTALTLPAPEPVAPVDARETPSGYTQASLMRAGDTQAVAPVVTAREIAERINRDARERLIRLAPEYDTVDMGECLIRQFVDAAIRHTRGDSAAAPVVTEAMVGAAIQVLPHTPIAKVRAALEAALREAGR